MNHEKHESHEKGMAQYFFRASAEDFKKIPGSPIAYWASGNVLDIFKKYNSLSEEIETREGLTTGSNDLFLRVWFEVPLENIGFEISDNSEAQASGKRWFTCVKGGDFRRWSGNFEYIVNWFNDGKELREFKDSTTGRVRSHNYNGNYAFRTGFTWSGISSGTFALRHVQPGFMFDTKGPMGFSLNPNEQAIHEGILNSVIANYLIKMLAPTLDFKLGHILNLPIAVNISAEVREISRRAVSLSLKNWNSYETSWDFTQLPLLSRSHAPAWECIPPSSNNDAVGVPTQEHGNQRLSKHYQNLRTLWQSMTNEMQRLEQENNCIFIEAYGLQEEPTPEVPLKEITLTCNPHYRYGGKKSDEELEALLLADTMKEFISYAVGCMFGRYSLDKEGLILANQGESIEDYYEKISNHERHENHENKNRENFRAFRDFRGSNDLCGSCLFPADDDNVIPMLDGDWFTDDITERFFKFLRITFGEEYYEENLKFIEQAIGKSIRKYFLKDFYSDHVKRYKKRPIYWLFSSPKGSFNALIYMHRYRPDTASVVLNDYLREFRTKLSARKNHLEALSISASAAPSEKTKALKEIEKLNKVIAEIEEYEREVLYPLATEQVEIDLDDGVKVNYNKFGNALKKIPGLLAKGE